MAVIDMEVPDEEPKRSAPLGDDSPGESGLRPLKRLTSDSRLDRINGDTLAQTELPYHSLFARDFLRGNFNFAAAKMTVARGGKLIAIEAEFRIAEAWFKKAIAWADALPKRQTIVYPEMVTLQIKHAMSGRLVRLLTIYDQLFLKTTASLLARAISAESRQSTLDAGEARIKKIAYLCIPDNDQFAPEGVLLPGSNNKH
ncbi:MULTISPECIES: DUF1845 domain-containing protein [unclassified Caballeronia]|uniref:DUF1845 domain-containing protein n=1 Tax=unclassified Caballeronia TaxID=2646786 RepID=UPI00285CCA46|nr:MULTISPECIES: DUF1845 domain-containing protein [unclassified Caballeronia]MDR5777114.1 DUF1845 domain-containing protein [Caballeronia sp. LZ002]MDR5798731.1 DUF1845 domain-containing protein [Caballeronia sp. LZ001]MDR5852553.1 DUF1845 domain-containing protein [Caballeronia sp. LZ003]